MRVSESRYSRDIRRIDLARRLIRHRVRTQWICAWTGLSGERVRNLYHSYSQTQPARHRARGPSPRRTFTLLRSPRLQNEASALGGIAYRLGLIPAQPVRNPEVVLAGVDLGEQLCKAFELYHQVVPGAGFTMEQFILLVFALAERKELDMALCESCRGFLIVDCTGTSQRRCPTCRKTLETEADEPLADEASSDTVDEPNEYQQSLFDSES